MRRIIIPICGLISLVFITAPCWSSDKVSTAPADYLTLTGNITNPQGKGLKEVKVAVFVDGKELHLRDELITHEGGNFQVKLTIPEAKLPGAMCLPSQPS